jgi:hypothetical protein
MTGAVITADIVNSTKLSRAEYKKLEKGLSALLEPYLHEFFRGDSMQVFVKSPNDALRLLLQLRVAAIKISSQETIDIRASIGISSIKLPVKSLKTASGEAFVLSGRAFDKMAKEERLAIVCDEKNKAVNLGLKIIAQFIDFIFQKLTIKQAAVVSELMMRKTQIEAAKKLKKSQATVHKHTQAAGWPQIEMLLQDYENLIALIEP